MLQSNIIRNNIANGESAIAGNVILQNLTMVQNLIYGNSDGTGNNRAGLQLTLFGSFQSQSGPMLTEINNTIYGGQELVLSFGPSTIENNIFANPTPAPEGSVSAWGGLTCDDTEAINSPITIQNNDNFVIGAPPGFSCTLGSGNIATEPNFIDPANGDFHEQQNSPTIAAGSLNAPDIPTADLDNNARVVCNTIDMGVYELRPHPPITLTSSLNPAPGGSSINFTATLAGANCNVPTGTVTFLDGGQAIGTATLNGSAIASLTTSLLVVGRHMITATYPGDFNFNSSASNVLVQTITGDPTATTLSVSPNPATAYSPITLQSRVTSPYGTPTGQVEFFAGANPVATAALNAAGQASATVSTLGAGTYAMTARYTADTRFQPSTSPTVQETITGANTLTTLTANPNPAAVTQAVIFTMSVHAAQSDTHIPGGTVTLLDGGKALGAVPVTANGTATFSTSSLSYGVHTITAKYGGSGDFNPSSATLQESVTLIGTNLSLSATPNPADTGQTVTMTATASVSVPGSVPFGMVTFRDGTTVLGTAALNENATAAFTASTLAVGTHPLSASLSGSADLAGSVSPIVNEVVQAYSFTVQPSKAAISLPTGNWTEFPVTITPVGGFHGTVQLNCGNLPDNALCTFPAGASVSLASGAKTITLAISASDVYGYGKEIGQVTGGNQSGGYLAVILMPPFGLLCLAGRRRLSAARWTLLLLLCMTLLVGAQGCGSKQPGKAVPGNYNILLTGTSRDNPPLTQSATIQLTVTQ